MLSQPTQVHVPMSEFSAKASCGIFGTQNTTITTMSTWKPPKRAITLAQAEAYTGGHVVSRSTKRRKRGGEPFEIIRVLQAPKEGSTSFRPRVMGQASHNELPEDPMDVSGLFQENMTNFGPEDAPRKRRRAPGLVRGEQLEAYSVIHIHNSRRLT